MKLSIFTFFYLLCSIIMVKAQVPQKMNYQMTYRNAAEELFINKPIGLQFTIIDNSLSASNPIELYKEQQITMTDNHGVVRLNIGEGTAISGDLASIDWSKNVTYKLNTRVYENADTTSLSYFSNSSSLKLDAVPIAIYAEKAGGGLKFSVSNTGDTLSINGAGFLIVPGISTPY